MNVRTVTVPVAAVLLVAALAGCTQTIAGTPGPRPTVSGTGDFPTGSETATGSPTGSATDSPTTSTPTTSSSSTSTGVTTDNPASVQTLCANLDVANRQGGTVSASVVKQYVATIILAWGLANSDTDPYSKADAATISACPDVRTGVLTLMKLPDLKSTKQ